LRLCRARFFARLLILLRFPSPERKDLVEINAKLLLQVLADRTS
jgi:hypothetical protein